MSLTYADIQGRLSDLDDDLLEKQGEFEKAATEYFNVKREWEETYARTYAQTDHTLTATERKQDTLLAIAAANDLHERYSTAAGRWEGLRAAVRVIETRVSIGQSLLKSMTRESGPSPQFSGAMS